LRDRRRGYRVVVAVPAILYGDRVRTAAECGDSQRRYAGSVQGVGADRGSTVIERGRSRWSYARTGNSTHEVRKQQSNIVAVVQQDLESIRVVTAFGRQELEQEELAAVSRATVP
jgi:ABC-type multidrug transport system fused ATPase/permease subunit